MSSFCNISKHFIKEDDDFTLKISKHHSLNISKCFIEPSSPIHTIKATSSECKFRLDRSIRFKPLDFSIRPTPFRLESKFSSKMKELNLLKKENNESTCEYEESLFINNNENEKEKESYSKLSILTILENKFQL